MAQALIEGRIDCKTAGQMVVHLQTMSKLLWIVHGKGREGRKENQESPQICADERRSNKAGDLPEQKQEVLNTKDTRTTPLSQAQGRSGQATEHEGLPLSCADRQWSSNRNTQPELRVAQMALRSASKRDIDGIDGEDLQVAFKENVSMFPASRRDCRDGAWQQARAA
jgi:hypothetical protein